MSPMTVALIAAVILLTACNSTRAPSPLEGMMRANARGEVACVRDAVLKHGRDCK